MDTDINTSLRARIVRTRVPSNVGKGGQTVLTLFNICKGNAEWPLKDSLKAFKLNQSGNTKSLFFFSLLCLRYLVLFLTKNKALATFEGPLCLLF